MSFPLHIAFRNMDTSAAAEALVREQAATLADITDRINACRVVLDCVHRQNHVGRLYSVHVDLTVPGASILVNRDTGSNHAHDDLHVAIRDSFDTARRKLREMKSSSAKRERTAHSIG